MPLHILMPVSDCLIGVCCLAVAILALDKSRVQPNSAKWILLIGILGVAVGTINFLLDTGLRQPRLGSPVALLAFIHLTGASKGLLMGLFLSLVLFKQLRGENRTGN